MPILHSAKILQTSSQCRNLAAKTYLANYRRS